MAVDAALIFVAILWPTRSRRRCDPIQGLIFVAIFLDGLWRIVRHRQSLGFFVAIQNRRAKASMQDISSRPCYRSLIEAGSSMPS